MNWPAIVAVGAGVGLVAGLFGKGGSALATPLLHALGVPAIVAVAAPLPATIPSTLVATAAYWRERLLDERLLRWSIGFGVPATVVGAVATRWISGGLLVTVTDLIVAGLGVRFLLGPGSPREDDVHEPPAYQVRLAVVGILVGVTAGLLANSGGFLLAPLYLAVLRRPVKTAFACSLAVAAVLAVPGTIVHWALGHIDWAVVVAFGAGSIPLSYVGGRLAVRSDPERLQRGYGAVLVVLGVGFLIAGR